MASIGGRRLRDIWTALALAGYGGGALVVLVVGALLVAMGVLGIFYTGRSRTVPYEMSPADRTTSVVVGSSLVVGGLVYFARAVARGTARERKRGR